MSVRGWPARSSQGCCMTLLPGTSFTALPRPPVSDRGSPKGNLGGALCLSRTAARQSPRRALPRGRRQPLSTATGLSATAVAVCLRGGPGGLGVGKAWEPQPWSWKGPQQPSAPAPGHAGRPRNLGRERSAEDARGTAADWSPKS